MTTFGQYEVLEVLHENDSGGARRSVSTARQTDDPRGRTFVVKHFAMPQPDPDEPHWEPQYFLDRARVQQSVVAAGGRHWLAVHDMGLTDGPAECGAYYVADYHPISGQSLVDGQVRLSAAAMHAIVN